MKNISTKLGNNVGQWFIMEMDDLYNSKTPALKLKIWLLVDTKLLIFLIKTQQPPKGHCRLHSPPLISIHYHTVNTTACLHRPERLLLSPTPIYIVEAFVTIMNIIIAQHIKIRCLLFNFFRLTNTTVIATARCHKVIPLSPHNNTGFWYWISHLCSQLGSRVWRLCSRIRHACTSIRHLGNRIRRLCNGIRHVCTKICHGYNDFKKLTTCHKVNDFRHGGWHLRQKKATEASFTCRLASWLTCWEWPHPSITNGIFRRRSCSRRIITL